MYELWFSRLGPKLEYNALDVSESENKTGVVDMLFILFIE